MKKLILFLLAFGLLDAHAQKIDVKVTESYSPYIFGHNLEHTRSAINGGLSAPVGEGAIIIEPTGSHLTANGQMFAMMKAHQEGKICKVTENDDLSTTASVKDGILTITLINAAYNQERNFNFPIRTTGKIIEAKLYSSDDVRPFSYFTESALPVTATKKTLTTTLPPHSAAIIQVKMKQ